MFARSLAKNDRDRRFFSIPFKPILDQISGEKQLKLSLAEFVYVLAAVKFCRGMR